MRIHCHRSFCASPMAVCSKATATAPRGVWTNRQQLARAAADGPVAVSECYQSVISACGRIIRCGGVVDDDMAIIIWAQLLYLDAVDPNKLDIAMYVNSPGESVTAGKRYSLPYIHQPLGGAEGGQTDIDIQSLGKTNQDTDRDFVTSVKEAKEYGLIDEST